MSESVQDQQDNLIVETIEHDFRRDWVEPNDPILLDRLEWFKDQKLGLMMHWGPYSQLGVVESWALSDKDATWSREGIDWEKDSEQFKRQYFALNKTFNPIRFQPDAWADLAYQGGFKYLIFTTKHHDGFCMWDTQTTDFKVTGIDCPFHFNKYADICRHLFDAFRAKNLAIAAYFSKADWHTPYYWVSGMKDGGSMWRGPSYDPKQYPWLWEQFVKFTHEQIIELMTKYGRIDILWLDAGWVAACNGQDVKIGDLVEEARKLQPWLIVADRTVGGLYENYLTPEQTIPKQAIKAPWESCITMGNSFSFAYEDNYKSLRQIVHILIEIVSKGGNLALNVGPQPDGRLPKGAVNLIKELGAWLKVYGEAIYDTRIREPYCIGNCSFTCKGNSTYCFFSYENSNIPVSQSIIIPFEGKVNRIDLLGSANQLDYEHKDKELIVKLPEVEVSKPAPIAHVFRIT